MGCGLHPGTRDRIDNAQHDRLSPQNTPGPLDGASGAVFAVGDVDLIGLVDAIDIVLLNGWIQTGMPPNLNPHWVGSDEASRNSWPALQPGNAVGSSVYGNAHCGNMKLELVYGGVCSGCDVLYPAGIIDGKWPTVGRECTANRVKFNFTSGRAVPSDIGV
jgi:hypothetical protein